MLVANRHRALRLVGNGESPAALVHLVGDLARKLERGQELLERLEDLQLAHAIVDECEFAVSRPHIGDVDTGIARKGLLLSLG
jgi:hypothetical protein